MVQGKNIQTKYMPPPNNQDRTNSEEEILDVEPEEKLSYL